MQRIIIAALPLFLGLSACAETDAERGIYGAAGGAVVADAVGIDPLTGAVLGGATGYFCRDLNVLGCRK